MRLKTISPENRTFESTWRHEQGMEVEEETRETNGGTKEETRFLQRGEGENHEKTSIPRRFCLSVELVEDALRNACL